MSRKKGDAVALRKNGTEVDLAGDGIALAVGALDVVAEDSALPLVNIIEKVRFNGLPIDLNQVRPGVEEGHVLWEEAVVPVFLEVVALVLVGKRALAQARIFVPQADGEPATRLGRNRLLAVSDKVIRQDAAPSIAGIADQKEAKAHDIRIRLTLGKNQARG